MSNFLRSIGFSNLSKFDLAQLRDSIQVNFNKHRNANITTQTISVEYFKKCGNNIGLILNGFMDHDNETLKPVNFFAYAESDFNMHVSSFSMMNYHQGTLIIFNEKNTNNQIVLSMLNYFDFMRNEKEFTNNLNNPKKDKYINFAALSLGGKILLPATKAIKQIKKREVVHSNMFILEPNQNGMPATKEIYTTKEESLKVIHERLKQEDFFSIVDSHMIPSDKSGNVTPFYDILGTIKSIKEIVNEETGEGLYKLTLEVTGMYLQVFINKKDIVGMPIVGMRFSGNGKLQGVAKV